MISEYANIIFDRDRAAALDLVHGYLNEVDIAWCGRTATGVTPGPIKRFRAANVPLSPCSHAARRLDNVSSLQQARSRALEDTTVLIKLRA